MKNLVIILTGVAVFVAGLAAAGALTPRINVERQEQNLMVSDTVYDLPPEMAIYQAALGTFRGLAVNFLWERAETLKNQGKFHEAIELGKLITKLQPRYPAVWEFVSWNQAYNISVATHTPMERWMWVKSGIDLLQQRGGGIDANPYALALYQQLGWIYFHKVGEFMDNMNWHYKRELADMWHSILGIPPRDRQEYLRYLQTIVDAPDSMEALPPGAQRVARWMLEQGHQFDRHTLRKFNVPFPVAEEREEPSLALDPDRPPDVRLAPQIAWPDFATDEDLAATLAFLRRKAIMSPEINMNPADMYRMVERFGPIDFRHPASHALYWSQLGLERLGTDDGRQFDNEINTKRNVLNALQTIAQSGQVIYQAAPEPGNSYISYLPFWDFWIAYDDYFVNDVLNDPRRASDVVEEEFGPGHRNQMETAIAMTYAFGDEAAADRLYRRMQDKFQGTEAAPEYEMPLSDFALQQLFDTLDQPQVVRSLIVGLITHSVTSRAVHRDVNGSEEQFRLARRIYDEYRRLNPNPMDPLYQELPDWDILHVNALASFIGGNGGPAGVQQVPLAARSGIYRSLPPNIRAIIYLQQGQELTEEAMLAGVDPQLLFPSPPPDVLEAVRQQLMQAAPQNQQPGGARQETR